MINSLYPKYYFDMAAEDGGGGSDGGDGGSDGGGYTPSQGVTNTATGSANANIYTNGMSTSPQFQSSSLTLIES